MDQYAISAIGRDRPGIVAAISGALFEAGGNLEDSRMAILGGHFSMMLTVHVPADAAEALAGALEGVRAEMGLDAVSLNPIAEAAHGAEGATHVLSVYGADHPGIVHTICRGIAEHGANITDLKTQLAGDESNPLYVMLVELTLGGADPEALASSLETLGAEAQVEVSLGEIEVEAL